LEPWESFTLPAFARKGEIAEFFTRSFQNVDLDPTDFCFRDISDPTPSVPPNEDWILVTEQEFTLMACLYPKGEWCEKVMLGVSGGDSAAHAVEAVLKRFGLRAYDGIRKEFFDSLDDPTCRIREERAAREQYMAKLYENA
jgi:hypothetical protein